MNLDFWWLLIIPVVFGLGWVAARFDLKHLLSEHTNLPRSYFRGLNFLLNEQPDKAIDAFIEIVKLDPETTELHFALGSLFRRRGETERAIRVHQNLLNRIDLPVTERDHALYELGQDFLKAGLLDRAEATFHSLNSLNASSYASDAQQSLLTIYSIEKDWHQAIAVAQQLESMGVRSYKKEIAQFYCELAEEALQRGSFEEARNELELAHKMNPANVRATILLGDVEIANAHPAAAITHWTLIEKQDAAYLPLVAERLITAYTALGRKAQGAHQLIDYLEHYQPSGLLNIVYPYVAEHEGINVAYALVRRQMESAPNLTGMIWLIEAQLATAEEPRRSELEWMRTLVNQQIKNLPRYLCQNCGFRARLFYWQCPSCSGWETYAPHWLEQIVETS